MSAFEFSLPAVRGYQSGRPCYSAMCPVRHLPKLFPTNLSATVSDDHAFRKADMKRVREIARHFAANAADVTLSAVTISVESRLRFVSTGTARRNTPAIGELQIPLDARLVVQDGIHRIYGLQGALRINSALADFCLPLVLIEDSDGSRRGQIFSDVKRHERSSPQSLRIGLDDRDDIARLTREMIPSVEAFVDSIEMEKTAISNRTRKLFTLSGLYQANQTLLSGHKDEPYGDQLKLAIEFWTIVAALFPQWSELVLGPRSSAEIRQSYVHVHGIGLAAIARAGRELLRLSPRRWKAEVRKLAKLDFSRDNRILWEGRAMIGGKLSKSSSAVAATADVLITHLGLKD